MITNYSLKRNITIGLGAFFLLVSCSNKEKILDALVNFNNSKEAEGYHFGDQLKLPKEVTENAEQVAISFGDHESSRLTIDPKFFTLGDNEVTFIIKTKNGETLNQDATINVFAKTPEQNITYQIIKDYPHDPENFVEGFLIEGNTVYESDGLEGASQLIKYTLGAAVPTLVTRQPAHIFSEGCAVVGDKIFQLTYRNRKIFVYDKNTFRRLSEFRMPKAMKEGWGLTYDGENLIATDGSKNLFYLDVNDPSEVVKTVSVAGNTTVYDKLNELEYHDGFIYANVWHQPFILKINPATGEVAGKLDFTKITEENVQEDSEHVLNGIAFKGNNMLVTGKNWPKIYEVSVQ
nr:glutaminyl-peptide cyclotransferase [Chryseobacterium indologenes]